MGNIVLVLNFPFILSSYISLISEIGSIIVTTQSGLIGIFSSLLKGIQGDNVIFKLLRSCEPSLSDSLGSVSANLDKSKVGIGA